MNKINKFLIIAIIFIVFISTSGSVFADQEGFEAQPIVSGLNIPTAFAFAPNGKIFIGEKGGVIRLIENEVLLQNPVITLPDVNTSGDRGLLGLVVDPSFSTNGFIYVFYTRENNPVLPDGPKTGVLRRLTVVNNVAVFSSSQIILGSVEGSVPQPSCTNFPVTSDCVLSDSLAHSTGGLRFGSDGKLWVSMGDGSGFNGADPLALRSQSIDALSGKILRINTDGTAPIDNPFYDGNNTSNRSKVWALGLRNPYRFNFNPSNNKVYIADVGWYTAEEINKGIIGANYGWPCIEGASNTAYNCSTSTPSTNPIYIYGRTGLGASVTGGSFAGSIYPPEYQGDYFFADFSNGWLRRIKINSTDDSISHVTNILDNSQGAVDIQTGPDGSIYFLSVFTGSLNKLVYDLNRTPIVQISATPISGNSPLSVSFSSVGTIDPDNNLESIVWDFGDGSTISNEANPTHIYQLGTFTATLTATDILGRSASKTVTIYSGTQLPPNPGNTRPHLLSVSSLPLPAYIGRDVTLTANIINSGGTDPFVVDVEVYNSEGVRVTYNAWTDVSLLNEESRAFSFDWFPVTAGTYRVSVGLFFNDWRGLHEWNNYYYTFVIEERVPSENNLILNNSFETPSANPSIPENWLKGGSGLNTRIFTYPAEGFDSTKAARIDVKSYSSGDAKWVFNNVAVTPGKQYKFKDIFRSDVATTVTAQYKRANGSVYYKWLGNSIPSLVWSTFEGNFTVPSDVVSVTVFHLINKNGFLEVDNYNLDLVSAGFQGDIIRPAVSVSSPQNGASVSNTFSISSTATDNNGVERVQYIIDGFLVDQDILISPYNASFDSRLLINGSHQLQAQAWDNAGNTRISASINFTVNNTSINLTSSLSGSLSFDGIDDYVNFERWNIEEVNGFTIEAIFKPKNVTTSGSILEKSGPSGVDWSLGYKYVSSSIIPIFSLKNTKGETSVLEGPAITENELVHISAVYDGKYLKLFKNGLLIAIKPFNGDVSVSDNLVYMGNNPYNFSEPFKGEIDSVRVWTLPKNINEIIANINTESIGTGNGLIKHWKLNEGFGQDVIDSSNSGHHGILGSLSSIDSQDPSWLYGLGGSGAFIPTYQGTTISRSEILPGQEILITSSVKNEGTGSGFAIFYYDIFDADGNRVYNRYFDGESLSAGETKQFSINWSTNTLGEYRVVFAVMKLNWSGLYFWENDTGHFLVQNVEHIIYGDQLNRVWTNWSWNTNTDFSNTDPSVGNYSLKISFSSPWAGLYISTPIIQSDIRTTLSFDIKGDLIGNQNLQIKLLDQSGVPLNSVLLNNYLNGGAVSTSWKNVSIPLSDLGITSTNQYIKGVILQGASGLTEEPFKVDSLKIF